MTTIRGQNEELVVDAGGDDFQSITQSKFIQRPLKIPTQKRSRPRPSGKEQY